MVRTSTKHDEKISTLLSENKTLREENKKLKLLLSKSQPNPIVHVKTHLWRKFGVVSLLSIAAAFLCIGNILFWAGNTIVDTTRFVNTIQPITQNSAFQKSLASEVNSKIYERFDVEAYIASSLPEKAVFLAPALSGQIQKSTESAILYIIQSEKFQQKFSDTLQKTHANIIQTIKNGDGDGYIDISELYTFIRNQLQDTKLSFLASVQLPEKIGSIRIIEVQNTQTIRSVVTHINTYQTITVLIIICATAGAIVLSNNKRKMAIIIGVLFASLMLITLISIRIGGMIIINSVQPQFKEMSSAVYTIIIERLVLNTRLLLVVSVLLSGVAWVSGGTRFASKIRSRVALVFNGQMHQLVFKDNENKLTYWVRNHKQLLQWSCIAVAGFLLLFVTLTPSTLFWITIIILLLVLLIETIAAPKK